MAAEGVAGNVISSENDKIQMIADRARQWAMLHGLQLRPTSDPYSTSEVEHALFTLFPSVIPTHVMHEAMDLQRHFNRLMNKSAHDHEFLQNALKNVLEVDIFTKKLWDIYTEVRSVEKCQKISLGMFRNDFMIVPKSDRKAPPGDSLKNLQIKQIEFNTIAVAGGGLATAVPYIHRYTLSMAGIRFSSDQMRDNRPIQGLAQGMVAAWELYNVNRSVIIFVVVEGEQYAQDQTWLEAEVFKLNPDIRVKFATLLHIWHNGILTEDRRLMVDGEDVAIVYFRAGYSPDHYPTNKEWSARLMIEKSLSIKCPSVQHQLVGCKKVQQELTRPGVLERLVQDPDVRTRIRNTFAAQYSLDMGPEGDNAVTMAMNSPDKFVLKPQREGGGNNIYGDEIPVLLSTTNTNKERNAYILMERLFPWSQYNYIVKKGVGLELKNIVNELGIFGVYIGSDGQEVLNTEAGFLIKSRDRSLNEGSVRAGSAAHDSAFLLDDGLMDGERLSCYNTTNCGEELGYK